MLRHERVLTEVLGLHDVVPHFLCSLKSLAEPLGIETKELQALVGVGGNNNLTELPFVRHDVVVDSVPESLPAPPDTQEPCDLAHEHPMVAIRVIDNRRLPPIVVGDSNQVYLEPVHQDGEYIPVADVLLDTERLLHIEWREGTTDENVHVAEIGLVLRVLYQVVSANLPCEAKIL